MKRVIVAVLSLGMVGGLYAQVGPAGAEAGKALKNYITQANIKHLDNEFPKLVEYLNFFRSWYQSVSPAPQSLLESLSPDAQRYVQTLKDIAQKHGFVQPYSNDQAVARTGTSRLSADGEKFYTNIIERTSDDFTTRGWVIQQQKAKG